MNSLFLDESFANGVDQANLEALFQQELAVLNRQQYQQCYNKQAHDKVFRNR